MVDYWSQYCTTGPERKRQNAICAMSALMKYLHKRNDVPACYSLALFNENAEKIAKMHVIDAGTAFHPSMDLEPKAEAFLSALDEWQYLESSKNVFRNSLTWYFLFLEINEVNHSEENTEIFSQFCQNILMLVNRLQRLRVITFIPLKCLQKVYYEATRHKYQNVCCV